MSIPFLKSVAKAYIGRYPNFLSEFCFVFPNKRSGTFFTKYLSEVSEQDTFLSPAIMTITDLISFISGKVTASSIDQIFLLYNSYLTLLESPDSPKNTDDTENEIDFDSFRRWGETVISDFSIIDQYLVDPDEIFKNVKDFREISSNFLTDEQKEIIKEYFGVEDMTDGSSFWKNFDNEENLSAMKKKFIHLWRILGPLYHIFKRQLSERGLTTTGGNYREALNVIKERGKEIFPFKKLVFIGFNALSTSEHSIFRNIKKLEGYAGFDDFADFFWDYTGPILTSGDNSASKFIHADIKSFPAPDWALPILHESDNLELPEITAIAAPSNSAQVKIAGNLIGKITGKEGERDIEEAKVAVVLPDENLLVPLLYSLPDSLPSLNLTMGYPFRMTPVVSFVSLLRRTFGNMRMPGEEEPESNRKFFHKDIRLLVTHPFTQSYLGAGVSHKVLEMLDKYHIINPSIGQLSEISSRFTSLLDFPYENCSPVEVVYYLEKTLRELGGRLSSEAGRRADFRIELGQVNSFRDSLVILADALEEYSIKMSPMTAFRMADRLISGLKVHFEGEPLSGLQIMGTLETRSLDFENIIILSMNERVMPGRSRMRSFIPDTLRHAYAIPPANYAEEIFSYYFYRMISRAKKVTLVYDGRSSGAGAARDVSRYILQLRYLFAKDKMKEEKRKFTLSSLMPRNPSIIKTEEMKEELNAFCTPEGRRFSASTLNKYKECQIRFYYEELLRINNDQVPSEYIDAITMGNILHEVMMELYLPRKEERGKLLNHPKIIDRTYISTILENRGIISSFVKKNINRIHFHKREEELNADLPGASELIGDMIVRMAVKILRYDMKITPFKLYGCEIGDNITVAFPDGREVNFRYIVDRLDEIMVDGQPRLRIVDYKSGNKYLKLSEWEQLNEGGKDTKQIFQLFLYSWLMEKNGIKGADNMRTEIYSVMGLNKSEDNLPKIEKKIIEGFAEVKEKFEDMMKELIKDIFESQEFKAPLTEDPCISCPLQSICR